VFVSFVPQLAAAVPCESLASLSLPDTTITLAQTVAAGAFKPATGQATAFQNLPAFCRLTATLKPSKDSEIKMEVWLPVAGWNGNFRGLGSNGMGGALPLNNMATAVRNGYATAGTDTGHTGDSRYALTKAEIVTDFAYRAMHEMEVKGKAITRAYYEKDSKLSVTDGCGTAAFAAMNTMQRYPADVDGIAISGVPLKTRHSLWQLWAWDATHKDAASYISPEKAKLVENAVLDTCDALDGVTNREIEDPRQCKFDPKVLECKGAEAASCLTSAQVEAARKIYAGPTNPRTGKPIYFPPMPGVEREWPALTGAEPLGLASDWLKHYVFKDPNWDPKTRPFDYDKDLALAETPENLLLNADNPDIRPFIDRGGKLLLYEGWSDGRTIPGFPIDYYERVVKTIGAKRAQESVRLFMVPGFVHCEDRGEFEMVREVEHWIETGQAPDRIIGSRVRDGKVVGTRLLCAYPKVATYRGSGNPDHHGNYTCQVP
jgi:feruloyl esterase